MKKITFEIGIWYILTGVIIPIKPSQYKISLSVESYDEINAENDKIATLPKSA